MRPKYEPYVRQYSGRPIRTTISLPVELKARMDEVNRHGRVNWSGVARVAFEEVCEAFERQRESTCDWTP